MMRMLSRVLGFFIWAISSGVQAHDSEPYADIIVKPIEIHEQSATATGDKYRYPSGEPVLLAYRIVLKPGTKTSWHKHSVPLFAYVMSGALEIDYGSKGLKRFAKGEGFVEALDWCHQGRNLGEEDVIVLGLYLAQDTPDSAKPANCDGPQ